MKERIAVSPSIHLGKPCVAGTRIPVQSVLELVRERLSFAQIIEDYYSELEPEDIRACVQYAIDVLALKMSDWHPRHEILDRPGCLCRHGPPSSQAVIVSGEMHKARDRNHSQATSLGVSDCLVVSDNVSFLVVSAP